MQVSESTDDLTFQDYCPKAVRCMNITHVSWMQFLSKNFRCEHYKWTKRITKQMGHSHISLNQAVLSQILNSKNSSFCWFDAITIWNFSIFFLPHSIKEPVNSVPPKTLSGPNIIVEMGHVGSIITLKCSGQSSPPPVFR